MRTGECALSEMDRSSVANPSEDFKVRQVFVIIQGVRHFKIAFLGHWINCKLIEYVLQKTHFINVDPVEESL